MNDSELIDHLGGPAKVCELLKLPKDPGIQRVSNWKVRGIPAKVKLDHPAVFLPNWRAASTPEAASAATAPKAADLEAARPEAADPSLWPLQRAADQPAEVRDAA